jgi:diaminopimelate epimerase
VKISFQKYQATGNDFIIVDNRSGNIRLTTEQIQHLCDRKFGIGADGFMLIETHPTLDFNLIYYNSDGSQSLCGNGSRAAVQMAASLRMIERDTTFQAYDGPHNATRLANGLIQLKMSPVSSIQKSGDVVFIDTGSPHLIKFVPSAPLIDVVAEGRSIRYSEPFKPGGTNVNFAELQDGQLLVRTYERGVEDETLSCGTGVTAAALAAHFRGYTSPVHVKTRGGELSVTFEPTPEGGFKEIYLTGPAVKVFDGVFEILNDDRY